MVSENTKRYVIEPVTRVEGHGKVSILLDEQNKVKQARLHIVEFRGFEKFIQGRPYWEVPVLVQRLCGICPVSHHLAAAKAMDRIVGGENLTPTAEKMRRLCHYGQTFQSHVLHFFHLCSPDLLFGFDADPAIRNVIGVINKFPDLAVQGVMMRKYGQEIIKATAGKKIHGTGAIPGGVNKNLTIEERDHFLKDIDQMVEWAQGALKIAKDYTVDNLEMASTFGSFESSHMSLVRADGAMDLYDGGLRAIDSKGNKIFDHVDVQKYTEYLAEEVKDWSYMKFPFIKSIGPEDGWYRVGPLARINTCDFIDTPLAEKARQEFMALTDGKPNNITLAYHWTRMIETVHAIEKIKELLNDPDLQGTDLVVKGKRREETVAMIEAPRGTLIHHYRVNKDDQVEMANLIVSTTHNNKSMNAAVTRVAEDYL
ncbi:MAG: Ni/Fe hydrogenase subunit alpha, partial [Candidatus Omnitrophica bacterium]|nr:Ni/Fe hydrogenase subunit alpha [Candidatus Omnitrophota bacterium]